MWLVDRIRRFRSQQRLLYASRRPILDATAQMQPQLLVNPVNALVVPDVSLATSQLVTLPESASRTLGNANPEELFNDQIVGIFLRHADVIPTARRQASDVAGHSE